MKNASSFLVASVLVLAMGMHSARACTALMITDKQGNVYSAKTMEYAAMMPFEMSYVPA